ncbi:MAG: acyltransferase 3 [Alphaproteobacteria bacterium]|nr:acyltransferase 3 [Alphaproteobacteria bacterium]
MKDNDADARVGAPGALQGAAAEPNLSDAGGWHAQRRDIQVLRALAVLLVVVYHSHLDLIRAGYLGVDIFFVISGFLITSMIKAQMEGGRFSFKEFYFRRAKRLLPAAYTTFTVTAIASALLLTATEFRQFAAQLLGAVTFTANLVLMRQGSYFGGDAELKPLLHTWSLSIEEQYYLVMPALLFFMPRRYWLHAIVVIVLGSFAACIAMGLWRPEIAFYSYPTRAWELGFGSIGAFVIARPAWRRAARLLFWPALAAMLFIPFYPLGVLQPGIDTAIVCGATLVVILSCHRILNLPALRPLAFIGDISYSLYLVHWPIFALVANLWPGNAPPWIRLAIIPLSILLAWAQYRYIENPIRSARVRFSWRRVALTASVSTLVIAIPYANIAAGRAPEIYAEARRANPGLGQRCVSATRYDPPADCMTGSPPTMVVWGDSYAMHLIAGIVAERGNENVVQATKFLCGPLIGTAPVLDQPGTTFNRVWAGGCLSFNDDVLDYIRRHPSIRTVVLASMTHTYVDAYDGHVIERLPGGVVSRPASVEAGLSGIARTVTALRAMGRKVVYVAPPPALEWDAGLCAERRLRGLPTFGANRDCAIRDVDYRRKRADVLDLLRRLPSAVGLNVIRFDDVMRRGDRYPTLDNGRILYIANGHLSYIGSELLARRMHIVDRIHAESR